MNKNIAIFGATSAIAIAWARQQAQQGHNLFLYARNKEESDTLANDLIARGANSATSYKFEANSLKSHKRIVQTLLKKGHLDTALIAYGTLPDQTQCNLDANYATEQAQLNGLSVVSLASHLATALSQETALSETTESTHIAIITSVAGDRGRASNFTYGSAKKLISTWIEGASIAYEKNNLFFHDIRPGFVDTPMTDHLEKTGPLWANPEKIASDINKAIKKNKAICYTPFFWKPIMLTIRHIPRFIFKKLNL